MPLNFSAGQITANYWRLEIALQSPQLMQNLLFELRPNLADALRLDTENALNGVLELTSVNTLAAELGLHWQPDGYQVQFTGTGRRILSRRENALIAQDLLDALHSLAANPDRVKLIPLAGSEPNQYALPVDERRIICTVDRSNSRIIVHLIGHWRELLRHH